MKTIPLTQGYEALVDDEDYEFLIQVGRWHPHKKKNNPAVYARHTYVLPNGKRTNVFMHWFIAGRAGMDLTRMYDHEDRNGLNNTRGNLRPANFAEQKINSRVHRNSASGIRGVRLLPSGSWRARIRIDGELIHLGCFGTMEAAAAAYIAAATVSFGVFAPTRIEEMMRDRLGS